MSGRSTGNRLAVAEARVEAARSRLSRTIGALQERASPQAIVHTVAETLKERGIEAVLDAVDGAKRRPAALGAVVTAIGLFLARRRIAGLLRRGATAAAPTSLPSKSRSAK